VEYPIKCGTKPLIFQLEADRLRAVGKWLRVYWKLFAARTPFSGALPIGYTTQKPGKIFLEVTKWPQNGKLMAYKKYHHHGLFDG
jgi:hypothetical protein